MRYSCNLNAVAEFYADGIKNVAPGIKKNSILAFELHCIETYKDHMEQAAVMVMENLVKATDDKDATVRDSALSCLGVIQAKLTESFTTKYCDKIPAPKQAKITESMAKVQPSKFDNMLKRLGHNN